MKRHFKKYWLRYLYSISLILLILFTTFIGTLFRLTNLPIFMYQIIGIAICGWWMLHLLEIFTISNRVLVNWTNSMDKKGIFFVILSVVIGGIYFDNIERSPITNILISAISTYYWSIYMDISINKITFWLNTRKNCFTKKQFERINAYMKEHNHFFIAEHNALNIYTLKLHYPSILHKEISTILEYFIDNPKMAILISKIFKEHVVLDKDNNLYIDGKLETNPSKIGFFLLNKMSDNSIAEININIVDDLKN